MPGKQSCLECRGIAGCVYYMLKFLKRPFAQELHTSYWNTPVGHVSFLLFLQFLSALNKYKCDKFRLSYNDNLFQLKAF